MTNVTLYHNPRCSNSRGVLAILRERGIEPHIVEYLKTPPSRAELLALIAASGLSARELIRSKEALFTELGLDAPGTTEDALVDAMLAHPVLINRPIVVTAHGTRLCRPPELVREILPEA